MKKIRAVLVLLCLCAPGITLAGERRQLPVPTLGEAGLVLLGVSLVGGGIAALRRRKP
jgi:hypothetical protein